MPVKTVFTFSTEEDLKISPVVPSFFRDVSNVTMAIFCTSLCGKSLLTSTSRFFDIVAQPDRSRNRNNIVYFFIIVLFYIIRQF